MVCTFSVAFLHNSCNFQYLILGWSTLVLSPSFVVLYTKCVQHRHPAIQYMYHLGIVVCSTLVDRITQKAYEMIFAWMFAEVHNRHLTLQVDVSLQGIVAGCAQRSALGTVLGEEVGTAVCKGCKVIFSCNTLLWALELDKHNLTTNCMSM